MNLQEIERHIAESIGTFPDTKDERYLTYKAEDGTINIHIGRQGTENEFIAFDWMAKNRCEGCGLGCRTLDELDRMMCRYIGEIPMRLF